MLPVAGSLSVLQWFCQSRGLRLRKQDTEHLVRIAPGMPVKLCNRKLVSAGGKGIVPANQALWHAVDQGPLDVKDEKPLSHGESLRGGGGREPAPLYFLRPPSGPSLHCGSC